MNGIPEEARVDHADPAVSHRALIDEAAACLRSRRLGDTYLADVACALIGDDGQVYTGVCIGGTYGLCAEQSAVSQMLTRADPNVRTIVAVWRDEHGTVHVLPPCGRCREFLRSLSVGNLDTDVILGPDHVRKLRELLPFAGWYSEPVT